MIRRGLRIDDDEDAVLPIKEERVSNFFHILMKLLMLIEKKTHLKEIWTIYYLVEPL